MPRFNRFPPSVRYLTSRLRRWTQPAVWVPLAVMCAGGLFIWEVAVHPERLSIDSEEAARSNNPASAALSADDSAIAAEIDSVPVLVDELNRSNSELSLLNSSLVKGKGLFDEIRDRGLEIPKAPSVPEQAVRNILVPGLNLANPAVSAPNSGLQNLKEQNSSATAVSSFSGQGGLISGIQSIAPDPAGTAAATFAPAFSGANSGTPSENPVPLSPLQAAMQKYQAANPSGATAAQNAGNSALLPDRATAPGPAANPANLLPTPATAQTGANPANFQAAPAPVPAPTTTIISDSQQFLNPAATVPAANAEWNPRLPEIPAVPAQPATVAVPQNPYQTNLSGFGAAPTALPAALPTVPPPVPLAPNLGVPDSRVINPQFSPNSANSQYQQEQPSQLNLPDRPNFGSVPLNANQGQQPIQPQPFSVPRQIPGRYIGGGEINTFANP